MSARAVEAGGQRGGEIASSRYGVAGTTAYLRLDHNAHWTTDVMAGAALGFSTARFTMNRRSWVQSHASISLVPADGGLLLAYTRPLH